jgi:hypothetical protein
MFMTFMTFMTFIGLDDHRWTISMLKFLLAWKNGRLSPAIPFLSDLAVSPR